MGVRGGSSPRVWGAPERTRAGLRPIRLIPTCVGSTVWHAHHQQPEQAHPHVCGEHAAASIMPSKVIGSSPRVWGARVAVELNAQAGRLIPTCVGSTGFSRPRIVSHPAHPHVCGEHRSHRRDSPSERGSSPRVWGAQLEGDAFASAERLIPTCVGSTAAAMMTWGSPTAHPHVCGEHARQLLKQVGNTGSSPRVWGAPIDTLGKFFRYRLIPTCVGSTA